MNVYTLVINGGCPAVGMDTAVYLQTDGIQSFAGVVDSVLFKGNALSENEALIAELESKNQEIDRQKAIVLSQTKLNVKVIKDCTDKVNAKNKEIERLEAVVDAAKNYMAPHDGSYNQQFEFALVGALAKLGEK